MKRFFVICFLAFFAVRSEEDINWSEVRPKAIAISRKNKWPLSQQKIVGGEEAVPHSFPYQVGLLLIISKEKQNWCGGSLITTEYVLTAGHCLDTVETAIVLLGSHNITELTDGERRIKVDKTSFIIHDKWDSKIISNDIALVKLPNPVELTQNIQLVHLPPRSLPDLTGKLVTASGWGLTSDKVPGISLVLHYVEIKVISQGECRRYYLFFIEETNVCTSGRGGKGVCSGDSGGPIVMQLDGSRTIVGLSSFAYGGGCEAGWPSAYTRVTSYLDWISSHTGLPIKG